MTYEEIFNRVIANDTVKLRIPNLKVGNVRSALNRQLANYNSNAKLYGVPSIEGKISVVRSTEEVDSIGRYCYEIKISQVDGRCSRFDMAFELVV